MGIWVEQSSYFPLSANFVFAATYKKKGEEDTLKNRVNAS